MGWDKYAGSTTVHKSTTSVPSDVFNTTTYHTYSSLFLPSLALMDTLTSLEIKMVVMIDRQ